MPNSSSRAPGERGLAWLLLLGGAAGLIAAGVLTVEKIALLRDPSYVPSCSINPVLSCGSVMSTDQAEAFGVPNPLLGIAGFAIVTTVGAALLAGARFRRWFWLGLQAGVTFGVVFVHWLIFQSLYRIGALCPYCMGVWAVTIPIFWYVTLHNLRTTRIGLGAARMHGVVLTCWAAVVAGLITARFWSYWTTLV
ncbi:vitamin K epoxide reductase family protein [Kribbella solani]|uniref:vitamin K epoxide reductase family protein n=1 Tax=Kribbella solani TaxID=236067 RepID=UPI0029A38EE4|nr:vitamin K epoxide reductase family protein [Kribbella solani]MDX2969195.1 vitamin K epoxide reductase family protein [Kribbella solani]MDX3006308.1 vitamin K epoxide reductase family protein [Kribbella solani]